MAMNRIECALIPESGARSLANSLRTRFIEEAGFSTATGGGLPSVRPYFQMAMTAGRFRAVVWFYRQQEFEPHLALENV
jgi:hypothetical protein